MYLFYGALLQIFTLLEKVSWFTPGFQYGPQELFRSGVSYE